MELKKIMTVLEKLALYGANTEKKILGLKDRDYYYLINEGGVRPADMIIIIELKENISKGLGISYILGGIDEKETKSNGTKDQKPGVVNRHEANNRDNAGGNNNQH